jgi:UDP-N-acetylglucosamine acyltransferase
MTFIHPTAVIEDGAVLGEDVYIGAFCLIGAKAKIDNKVRLESHVVIAGDTHIGEATQIFPFASIGHRPQDLKFSGEESRLRVGKNNQIREYVTLQPGTEGGGLETRIGDNNLFMACAHVAHDCQIGNHVILANNVMVAGHCKVGDHVIFGGGAGIHQFVRIGDHAFVGGLSGVENDVIPFGSVIGNRAALGGLNIVGLKRRGFDREAIHNLRKAYRLLFSNEGTLSERVDDVEKMFSDDEAVMQIITFIRAESSRSLCTPR